MSERHVDEKDEKQEKQEEKDEKNWDEKWRRDPLGSMVWAGILIWLGLVLLADNLNILGGVVREWWSLFFLGAGAIILLEVLVRLLVPAYRRPIIGSLILGLVFLFIGANGLFERWNWNIAWAVLIVAIGVFLLLRGFTGRPKE